MRNITNISIAIFIALLTFQCSIKKQTGIVFYNTENLFDTTNNVGIKDDEYTPQGIKQWNSERYKTKIQHLAKVISDIDSNNDLSIDIIGLCEIENEQVINDLVNNELLKSKNYKIIHFDSPDLRGIDVAILYNSKAFKPINAVPYKLTIKNIYNDKPYPTRDQLLVSGTLYGDTVHIITNHWPSRVIGQEITEPSRIAAAKLNRHIIDSIRSIKPNAKIITMGDFNDNPSNTSINETLRANSSIENQTSNALYNPFYTLHSTKTTGTTLYRGKWHLFDQIIMSNSLANNTNKGISFSNAEIYKPSYLIQQEGKYKGYPNRTYGGNTYIGGYSDHLPVYAIFNIN